MIESVLAAGCTQHGCSNGSRIVALSWGDLNPLKWLGKGAAAVATDAWKGAMTALWSAGLWILQLAFKIIDAFTTPDLSANGPLADVLPYTFAIGAMIAALVVASPPRTASRDATSRPASRGSRTKSRMPSAVTS